jgi:putative ABC transport system permease protein
MKKKKNIFFQLASRNVKLNLSRSLLAALGIIIGVVAITTMGILGANIQLAVSSNLSSNANSIIITPDTGGSGGFGPPSGGTTSLLITDNQVREIEQAAGHNVVVPIHSGSDLIQVGTKDKKRVTIYGLDPEKVSYFVEIADGISLRGASSGVLVGSTLARDEGITTGTRIKIGDNSTGTNEVVRVVGILKSNGFGIGLSPDNAIIASDSWYTSVYGHEGEYPQVDVLVPEIKDLPSIKDAIDKKMTKKVKVVNIIDSGALLETINSTIGQISMFILLLGGISLLVASVSIFNVMMMSVKDRINEIGVLRSIGTTKAEIRKMFIYEAFIIGSIGAGIGGLISFIGGYLLVGLIGTSNYFFTPASILYVPYGMAIGIGVCLLSGLYPASKAANLNPIEALRHD